MHDQELIDKSLKGDADAYCDLAERYDAKLKAQAFIFCKDASMVDELVQETLIQAWKSLDRFNGKCQFSTWLISIMFRRHKTLFKKRLGWLQMFKSSADELDFIEVDCHQLEAEEKILKDEENSLIQECIRDLPIKQREVIILRFFEGCSLDEIAQILDCSTGTVKSRLFNGLKKLRTLKKMNLSTFSSYLST